MILYSDGGGKRVAALRPIHGDENVARFFAGIAPQATRTVRLALSEAIVDGLPGISPCDNGEVMHTMAFEIDDGKITAIYIVRNPDKLRHVSAKVCCSGLPLPPTRARVAEGSGRGMRRFSGAQRRDCSASEVAQIVHARRGSPPTPNPSPPRAARAGGREKKS